jgi:hypothetical protein
MQIIIKITNLNYISDQFELTNQEINNDNIQKNNMWSYIKKICSFILS